MSEDKTPLPENPVENPETPATAEAPAAEPAGPQTPEGDIETDSVEMVVCPGCNAEIDTTEVPPFATIACPACGTELDVPAKFGGFRLLKVLGSGGMGSVFLGQDDALNRKVAIKVVKRSIGGNAGMLEGFQKEAQATAKLNHPNIVQIYAFGEEKGQPYIAMELVGGGSLDGLIEKKKRLDPAFVLRVGKEIAIALGAAQEAGLIHGDVKPENILFDENYRAKLVDFGIASALSSDVNVKDIWGTPYYIAPEKAKGKKADIRSDLYSLGATLYHALTLHPPFDGPDARAVVAARYQGPAAPIGKYRPDVEKKAIEIIERMMHSNPMLRFPTVNSLVASIDEFLGTVSPARAERPAGGGASVRLPAAKKMTAPVIASASGAPSGTVSGTVSGTKKGGKKIIIAKGGHKPRMVVPAAPAPADAAAGEPLPAEGAMPVEEQLPPGGIPEMVVEEAPKKNGVKIVIITVAAVFLLAIVGVAAFFIHLVAGEKQTGKENAAHVAEAQKIEKEAESYDKRVEEAAARIVKIDAEAQKLVADIEAIASKASETKWTAPSLDPAEGEIVIEAPKPAAPSAEAKEASAGADKPDAPAVDNLKAVKDDPLFADAKFSAVKKAILAFAMNKDNADLAKDEALIKDILALVHDPENAKDPDVMEIAVNQALEDAKKKNAAAASAAPAEEAPAATDATADGLNNALDSMDGASAAEEAPAGTAESVAEEAPAEAAPAEHEIITLAKGYLEPARRIRRCAKEAEMRRDRQSEMFTPIKGSSVTQQQYNERITFKKTREGDEKAILAMVEPCQKALAELKKNKVQLERGAKKFLEDIRVREAAEEKARQERIEEARKQQAADEQQARVQRDLDEVETLKTGADEMVKVYDYAGAVKHLEAYKGQYAAKEANEALQSAIDRCQRLADLKAFLLKDLHENQGLSWGLGTRDIVDADPVAGTITARGGATADIAKLDLKQWMGLINRLVAKREQNRPRLTLQQEGNLLYGAAIFCVVHGGGSESALKMAEDMARAATLKSEVIRLDIPRVTPELKGALETAE